MINLSKSRSQLRAYALSIFISIIFSYSAFANLSIVTFNIRNFSKETNTQLLKQQLNSLNADVIAIQEIKDHKLFKKFIHKNLSDYSLALTKCGGRGKQKLGVLYKPSKLKLLNFKQDLRINSRNGCSKGVRPLGIANFKMLDKDLSFTVYVVHLKSGNRPKNIMVRKEQYKILQKIIGNKISLYSENFVILGDFNTTGFQDKVDDHQAFKQFLNNINANNMTASVGCSAYWSGGNNDSFYESSHLDHILVSDEFISSFDLKDSKSLSHCRTQSCYPTHKSDIDDSFTQVSDHCPLKTEFY